MKKDIYVEALKIDKEDFRKYYQKFLSKKSEQQKLLERVLKKEKLEPANIADIACGTGTLTYHISKIYPMANYLLVDINPEAIRIAKSNNLNIKARYRVDSIYELKSAKNNYYDIVFNWQTLSWLDNPQTALNQLIRICKPGGRIFLSSLFNINYDVDIYSKVIDHTRPSSKENLFYKYNTYSLCTVNNWIKSKVKKIELIEFVPQVDFQYKERGIGTYTIKMAGGKRLQFSASMLLNWYILKIIK